MERFIPFSELRPDSRRPDFVVARDAAGAPALDWHTFEAGVRALELAMDAADKRDWIIHTVDTVAFLQALWAVWRRGVDARIPGNALPGTLAAIGGADVGLLLDEAAPGAIHIPFVARAGADAVPRPAPARDPSRPWIHFFTSGSTGEPKRVPKRLDQVAAEVANLAARWGAELEGRTVYSTVSHQHFYGFLFQAMLPLCAGLAVGAERVAYPETFMALAEAAAPAGRGAVAVVASPAFTKRLSESGLPAWSGAAAPILFSSGGVLPSDQALFCRAALRAGVHEIFGSTETGGIGWRLSPDDPDWTPFPGIRVRAGEGGVLELASPYLAGPGFEPGSDRVELLADGRFRLAGRVDTVVKIEEKRVALNEVENRLRAHPWVADAAVLALEEGRQFLAALVVPRPEAAAEMEGLGTTEAKRRLREWLHQWFEPTVLPRKWRFAEAVPLTAQGKRDRAAITALFAPPAGGPAHREPAVERLEHEGHKAVMEMAWPADSVWFQGHFPEFPILPGVVQIDWLMTNAERVIGVRASLKKISRLKFMKPILPGVPIRLEFAWDPDKCQLSFTYAEREGGAVCSTGKLILERHP